MAKFLRGFLAVASIMLAMICRPDVAKADIFAPWTFVDCVPAAGYFNIRHLIIRGNGAGPISKEDRQRLQGQGRLPSSGQGSCKMGTTMIDWSYEDSEEPGTGFCGAGDWGGWLTLRINGHLIFNQIGFAGDYGDGCRGSPIQEVTVNLYDGGQEIHLKGYWSEFVVTSPRDGITFPFKEETLWRHSLPCNVERDCDGRLEEFTMLDLYFQ